MHWISSKFVQVLKILQIFPNSSKQIPILTSCKGIVFSASSLNLSSHTEAIWQYSILQGVFFTKSSKYKKVNQG